MAANYGNYELYHHGILGQKWGKINGPPYPLGSDKHSKSEQKAGWRKSLGGGRNEELYERKRKLVLTDQQKKYIKIGAIAVGTALTIYGAYKYSQFYEFNKDYGPYVSSSKRLLMDKALDNEKLTEYYDLKCDLMYRDKDIASLSNIAKSSTDFFHSVFDKNNWKTLVRSNNPGYPREEGRDKNCFLCTTSLIMRLKGYNTISKSSSSGFSIDLVQKMFTGAEVKSIDTNSPKELVNTLLRNGDKHYGYLSVKWNEGGGHSILYYVNNGRVNFIDGQSGNKYDYANLLSRIIIDCTRYCDVTYSEPSKYVLGAILNK